MCSSFLFSSLPWILQRNLTTEKNKSLSQRTQRFNSGFPLLLLSLCIQQLHFFGISYMCTHDSIEGVTSTLLLISIYQRVKSRIHPCTICHLKPPQPPNYNKHLLNRYTSLPLQFSSSTPIVWTHLFCFSFCSVIASCL